MGGPKVIRSIEPLDQIVERCRSFMNDWLLFGQILSAYVAPGSNKAQLETQFLKLKSKLARDLTVLKDRLATDFKFDPNTLGVLSGTTNLESVYSQSEMAVKKLQNEWHRAFIAMNETLGIIEDKRRRVLDGEKVMVAGHLYHIRQSKVPTTRQVLLGMGTAALVVLVAGSLYFARHFLGVWAPEAGAGMEQANTMSDQEQIMFSMQVMQDGMRKEDVDQMMTAYSDRFRDPEGRGKTELRIFIQTYKTTGNLRHTRLDTSNARVGITGRTARVEGLRIITPDDAGDLTAVLSKEGERWLITSLEGL